MKRLADEEARKEGFAAVAREKVIGTIVWDPSKLFLWSWVSKPSAGRLQLVPQVTPSFWIQANRQLQCVVQHASGNQPIIVTNSSCQMAVKIEKGCVLPTPARFKKWHHQMARRKSTRMYGTVNDRPFQTWCSLKLTLTLNQWTDVIFDGCHQNQSANLPIFPTERSHEWTLSRYDAFNK